MHGTSHKHVILYAEDDHDDLYMVREAFQQFDHSIELVHVSNGVEAIDRLINMHRNRSLPCLVILDVNMPGMNGRETLAYIKQADELKNIPVALFTTSSGETDKLFAKKWNAEFITKPLVYAELEELARTFLNLCTSTVSQKA